MKEPDIGRSTLVADNQTHSHCCCCRGAYRLIMILYAAVCSLWMVVNFWMMPWHALQVGQVNLRLLHFGTLR